MPVFYSVQDNHDSCYQVKFGKSLEGGMIRTILNVKYTECKDHCDIEIGCSGFIYDFILNKCFIKRPKELCNEQDCISEGPTDRGYKRHFVSGKRLCK